MSSASGNLGQLDSCVVSDALDTLGLDGVLAGVWPVTGPCQVSGRVVTVELGPPTGQRPGRHLCTAAVEAAGPGEVIVVAHQGRSDCAGWGGNLSRAAARRGIAATIVHGAARDVDESRTLPYALFATGSTPRTARGRAQEHSWGKPVQLGNLTVNTGDYVVADSTGVVFIPSAEIGRVIQAARELAAREAAMAAAIDTGTPIGQVMGTEYESLIQGQGHAG